MKRIDQFKDEFSFLSNFWSCPVDLDGETYSSAEHAYQAAKTLEDHERGAIRSAPTAGRAKRLGKSVTLRPGWEDMRLLVMGRIVLQKFRQNPDLRAKLLATCDIELVEGNMWGDRYWGVDLATGDGENHLGKILMRVRHELAQRGANVEFLRRLGQDVDLFSDMLQRARISFLREGNGSGESVIVEVEDRYVEFGFGASGQLQIVLVESQESL